MPDLVLHNSYIMDIVHSNRLTFLYGWDSMAFTSSNNINVHHYIAMRHSERQLNNGMISYFSKPSMRVYVSHLILSAIILNLKDLYRDKKSNTSQLS